MEWLVANQEVVLAVLGAVIALAGSMGWSWVSALRKAETIIKQVLVGWGNVHVTGIATNIKGLNTAVAVVEAVGQKVLRERIAVKARAAGPLVAAVLDSAVKKLDKKPLTKKQRFWNGTKKVGMFIIGNLLARRLG